MASDPALSELTSPDPTAAEWEQAVDATPGIDPWCSGPDWVMSAQTGFAMTDDLIHIGAPERGHALLARYQIGPPEGGTAMTLLGGREPLWGFACPVLTTDPAVEPVAMCCP